jgi:hypothetical protein
MHVMVYVCVGLLTLSQLRIFNLLCVQIIQDVGHAGACVRRFSLMMDDGVV